MTEPKRYYSQVAITRLLIEQSNDMALVKSEQSLLMELYMEADMPRDFRIQFRYESLEQQDSVLCIGMLTVIDPTNPRIEEDKEWFKWINHAPVRTYNHNISSGVSTTTTNPTITRMIEQVYEPVMKAQLDQAKKFSERMRALDLDSPDDD